MRGENIRKALMPLRTADEALDALDGAMEQIVRIECAEANAQDRLRKLEAAIASYLADENAKPCQHELQMLFADYAEMDEVLFLEQAFREDERDRAAATIAEAQEVLARTRDGASDRRDFALSVTPQHVTQSARLFVCRTMRATEYGGRY